ncbi:hypothetical protein Cgig2_016612 [Carnegiea gigantea]|uniref:Uncharacterized protein n=1 Tax=Carnegiea gigantea TaxID=171969 RepID=A0A9Q1L086_9CARY|nr:hypothetical protein Cgig2_016612 [Carnegiea gigantea]
MMNDERLEIPALLNLIDDIQRLGLSDQFDNDIKSSLNKLACDIDVLNLDLRATALLFRILRQNDIWISQDEFERFKDDDGNFMESLGNDVEGMLNLYEASHSALEGEGLLDEAKTFAMKHLHDQIRTNEKGSLANHAMETLELPRQYRSPWVEARRFMETYLQDEINPKARDTQALLELAKLNFNMVQSMHRNELQEMSKWWKGTGLASKLTFSRDRLPEAVFFTISVAHKPELCKCRKALTKVVKFIALIDDIYDVYGHLDELEAFTSAIERWDINTIDGLPEYMRLAFLALYNTVNELGYEILKEKGRNCIPFLRKSWENMCKAFLVEARWYYKGHTPTYEEYLNNGWVSSSGPLLLTHSYLLASPSITTEGLDCLFNNHDLLRLPSIIFRLANDLATSEAELERGETINAMSSYAKEAGVSLEDAREHMKKLIDESWKGLNRIRASNSNETTAFSDDFVEIAINLTRTVQCIYQRGDGFGSPDLIKKRVLSLVLEPVQ